MNDGGDQIKIPRTLLEEVFEDLKKARMWELEGWSLLDYFAKDVKFGTSKPEVLVGDISYAFEKWKKSHEGSLEEMEKLAAMRLPNESEAV